VMTQACSGVIVFSPCVIFICLHFAIKIGYSLIW
jgi:hypothetical protein